MVRRVCRTIVCPSIPCWHCRTFLDVTITAKKFPNPKYPVHLNSLGDHIRKRRLDLGMHQKELAAIVNATTSTVTNWKKNRTNTRLYLILKIIQFLGYNPLQGDASTLGEKIRRNRILRGLSLRKLAKEMGVDPGTLSNWEKKEGGSSAKHQKILKLMNLAEM